MEVLSAVLLASDIVCTVVLVYCLYSVFRWALSRVSDWRVSRGKRAWSERRCLVLSLFAALSFIL